MLLDSGGGWGVSLQFGLIGSLAHCMLKITGNAFVMETDRASHEL